MINTTYRFSWKSKVTGYNYFLLFTPPHINPITHTYNDNYKADIPNTIVDMPEGCLNEIKYDWKFNNYPIGLCSAQNLKLSFNLNVITDSDFLYSLFNPFFEFDNSIDVEYLTKTATFDYIYRTGNILRLFCNFGDATKYREIYIGIQKSGLGGKYKIMKDSYDLECFDLNRCILESLNLDFLQQLQYSDLHTAKKCYYDWLYAWSDGGTPQIRATIQLPAADMNDRTNAYFWFYSNWVVNEYIRQVCKKVGSLLTRNADFNYYIDYDFPTCYKQGYTQLYNEKSTELAATDLYQIGFVANTLTYNVGTTKIYGGSFNRDVNKDYKTLWDYITDFALDNGLKLFFLKEDNSYYLKNIAFTTLSTDYAISIDNDNIGVLDLELNFEYEKLQKVESANQETIGLDVTKVVVFNNCSKAEKSEPLMVVHNTVPSAMDSDKNYRLDTNDIDSGSIFYGNPMKLNVGGAYASNALLRYSWQNRIKSIFYFGTSGGLLTEDMPIRVHSFCQYDFGTFNSSNINAWSTIDFNTMTDSQQPPGTTEAVYLQYNQSKNLQQAKSWLQIFSNQYQIGLDGEVLFSECNTSMKSVFTQPELPIYFNLEELPKQEFLYNYKKLFYLLECEVDFMNEQVKFKTQTISYI